MAVVAIIYAKKARIESRHFFSISFFLFFIKKYLHFFQLDFAN